MISVQEALDLVVANAGRQQTQTASLSEAFGRVLAQDVYADADSPPFDKAMMDGFAVQAVDVNAQKPLKILGEIRAGSEISLTIHDGETAAIMTGAPIPTGADAVVMIEQCRVDGGMLTTDARRFAPGMNVLRRGAEFVQNQVVLQAGQLLGPGEIGVLATIGEAFPLVYRQPTAAVLASGDELVPVRDKPGESSIRNSNSPTLDALLQANGVVTVDLGIAPDSPDEIERLVTDGLETDVLVITGGVSMGTADFIPQTLSKLGVNQVFHNVEMKPGKPVWFGTHERGLVFGLPGNPVSVLACFELFVTTALRARQGWADPKPSFLSAGLQADFTYPTKRETYHPAKLTFTDDGPVVSPVPWFGSADVLGASRADALAVLPVGPGNHKNGDKLRVLPLSKPGWIWTCSGVGGAS